LQHLGISALRRAAAIGMASFVAKVNLTRIQSYE
jgi:hypothetical protein